MADETVIADAHQFAYEAVRLNPCPRTDTHVFLYLNKWPYEAAIFNPATIQIDRLDHPHASAENDVAYATLKHLRQMLRHYSLHQAGNASE
ncbi:MAG: hypothetical protein QNJ42_17780 [Crocosphaera sp.]|nr:hypothetical protein [Crocosphaera sp.]